MRQAEFDRFADEYRSAHARSIGVTGEAPEFFAEYKVLELKRQLGRRHGAVKRLLDFGGGIGNSVPHLRKHLPSARVVVADVSMRSLEIAAQRFPAEASYVHIRDQRIPEEDGAFDVAFIACVFHHIDQADQLLWLAEIVRVVAPGGLIALFEHNPLNPLTMRAVSTCPFDVNARCIRMSTMRGRMEEAGMKIVASRYTLFFPALLRALRPLEPVLGWLPVGGQYVVYAGR